MNIDPYVTDSTIGRVRRLYVAQAARGQGVGQQLVRTIIQLAQGRFRTLHVRTANLKAARLYERLGFVPVVGVTDSTHFLDLGDSSNAFSIR